MSVEGINATNIDRSISFDSKEYDGVENKDDGQKDEFKTILGIINESMNESMNELGIASEDETGGPLTLTEYDPLDIQQDINREAQKDKRLTNNQKKAAGKD